jgi:hypothetical protein
MSRLVAFGCSNTKGDGLPDVYDIDKGLTPYNGLPSIHAWPKLLADKLEYECLNLAVAGCSNKHICDILLNTPFKKTDTVVFMWTYFSRSCFFQDDGSVKRIMVQDISCLGMPTDHRRWNKSYYKTFYTDQDAIKDAYFRANFAKLYLDSIGIKNYHTTCHEQHDIKKVKAPLWNNVELLDIGFTLPRIDIALDNDHPGLNSHKMFYNNLYNIIKEKEADDI